MTETLEKQNKALVETSPTLFWHSLLQAPAVPVWKPHKSLFALPAFLVSKVWLQPAKLSPTISSLWIWDRSQQRRLDGSRDPIQSPITTSVSKATEDWKGCSISFAHWWRHTPFQLHTWEQCRCTLKELKNQTCDGTDDFSSMWFWSISVRKKKYIHLKGQKKGKIVIFSLNTFLLTLYFGHCRMRIKL